VKLELILEILKNLKIITKMKSGRWVEFGPQADGEWARCVLPSPATGRLLPQCVGPGASVTPGIKVKPNVHSICA
jgi:hypothetical protein